MSVSKAALIWIIRSKQTHRQEWWLFFPTLKQNTDIVPLRWCFPHIRFEIVPNAVSGGTMLMTHMWKKKKSLKLWFETIPCFQSQKIGTVLTRISAVVGTRWGLTKTKRNNGRLKQRTLVQHEFTVEIYLSYILVKSYYLFSIHARCLLLCVASLPHVDATSQVRKPDGIYQTVSIVYNFNSDNSEIWLLNLKKTFFPVEHTRNSLAFGHEPNWSMEFSYRSWQ